MRGKTFLAAAALAAIGMLAVSGLAGAGGSADTKVTIKGGGEVFGYVTSSKPNKCAEDRKVTVYKQKGGAQGGGDDIKVQSDNASRSGDKYQWSIGNPGVTGKIFARAGKIPGCKADNSKTIPAGG